MLDGTLCLPQNWMFGAMRAVLGVDKKADVLEFIRSLPSLEAKKEAQSKIEKVEEDAMNEMVGRHVNLLMRRLLNKVFRD